MLEYEKIRKKNRLTDAAINLLHLINYINYKIIHSSFRRVSTTNGCKSHVECINCTFM